MLKKAHVLLAVLSTIAAFSCSDGGGRSLDRTPNFCVTERDCESGICLLNGRCAELVGEGELCDSSHRCSIGLECIDGHCKAISSTPCQTNANCPSGMICTNGLCILNPNHECERNSECAVGYLCKNHQCVPSQTKQECQSNADCKDGYICDNNRCVLSQTPQECQINADCKDGYICKAHSCVLDETPSVCIPDQLSPDGDYDRDDISNGVEIDAGLDPCIADTDGDGLLDGEEDFNHNGVYEPWFGETDPDNFRDPNERFRYKDSAYLMSQVCQQDKFYRGTTGHYKYFNVAKDPTVTYFPTGDDPNANVVLFEGDQFVGFYAASEDVRMNMHSFMDVIESVGGIDLSMRSGLRGHYNGWDTGDPKHLWALPDLNIEFQIYTFYTIDSSLTLQDIALQFAHIFEPSVEYRGAQKCDDYVYLKLAAYGYPYGNSESYIYSVSMRCVDDEHFTPSSQYTLFSSFASDGLLVAANRNGYNSPEVPEKGYEAFQTYICDAIDIHQSLDDPSNIKFDITGIPIASSIKVYVMYNSGDSTIAIEEVPHTNKVEWWWDGTGWLYDSMSPQVGYIEMDSFRTRGAELGADNVNVFVTYSIWQQPAE